MGHPKFSHEDFLGATLAIIAERGVSAVTVAAVSERLGSPTGSFYHRFASRDVLLASVWLQAVLEFQSGISAALGVGDGLQAALHTPAWVRKHPDQAHLLMLSPVYPFCHPLRARGPGRGLPAATGSLANAIGRAKTAEGLGRAFSPAFRARAWVPKNLARRVSGKQGDC